MDDVNMPEVQPFAGRSGAWNDVWFPFLAGLSISFQTRYAKAAERMLEESERLLKLSLDRKYDDFGHSALNCPERSVVRETVRIPEKDWQEFLKMGMDDSAYTEYSMLTEYTSDALLPFDRIVIHGAALRWHERAYLICAGSGVGKSTQAACLQQLRPGEFSVISGDRPVLEFRPSAPAPCHSERSEESVSSVPFHRHSEQSEESVSSVPFHRHSERSEESVTPVPERSAPVAAHSVRHSAAQSILVHPSPWNGKENWCGASAAPLAGLILLTRGTENSLCSLTPYEAAYPLYPQLIHSGREPETIHRAAQLEEHLLKSIPVWKLTSFQAPDSTRLLLDQIFAEAAP
ncbi:MAG: hypothetical protein IKO68_01220 [Oscillospiraceae bacterium]|nr:hypothetical protein [Oscillospiraceae bacterium]